MTPVQPMWLVRRQDLRILRPMPQEELIERIVAGEIASNDELCPANGYWFMLSEVTEVRRFLGDVNLACLHLKDGEENTSSTNTRPIQKSSSIPRKVVLENVVPKVEKRVVPFVVEADVTSQLGLKARRIKNAKGVAIAFAAFIAVLVWFWWAAC